MENFSKKTKNPPGLKSINVPYREIWTIYAPTLPMIWIMTAGWYMTEVKKAIP
jgi:hypothetical protein